MGLSERLGLLIWIIGGIAAITVIPASVTMSYYDLGGFQSCGPDELEVEHIFSSDCFSYSDNIGKVLDSMQRLEQPVEEDVLSQTLPCLTEKEIHVLLEEYQDRTGNVVYHGLSSGWEFVGNETVSTGGAE